MPTPHPAPTTGLLTYFWVQLMVRRLPWGAPKILLGVAVPQADGRGYPLQPSTLGLVSVQVLSLLDLGLHFFEGSRVTWGLKQKYMQARPIQVGHASACVCGHVCGMLEGERP